MYILCHEHVVHGDDVDLVNALCLELVVLFDISWCLRMTRGREGSRHANLFRLRIILARNGRARKKSSVCALSHTQKYFQKERKMDGSKTWSEPKSIVRTNMFLPEGASVIGLVASASLTFSPSGSLSPGFTCVRARSAAAWAWAVWAAPFMRVAMAEDILGV